jgi:hypothetical protein
MTPTSLSVVPSPSPRWMMGEYMSLDMYSMIGQAKALSVVDS